MLDDACGARCKGYSRRQGTSSGAAAGAAGALGARRAAHSEPRADSLGAAHRQHAPRRGYEAEQYPVACMAFLVEGLYWDDFGLDAPEEGQL